MPAIVLLLILVVIVVVFLRAREARKRTPTPVPRPGARRATRSRARQVTPDIDEDALAEHVAKLRQAVDGGLISIDEGAASIVRQTHGALSDEAARQLLRRG